MKTFRGVPVVIRVYLMAETDHDFSVGFAKVVVRIVIPCTFVSFVLFMFRERATE